MEPTNLLALLLGAWTAQMQLRHPKPSPAWMTTHGSCIPADPCRIGRELQQLRSPSVIVTTYVTLGRGLVSFLRPVSFLRLCVFIFLSPKEPPSKRENFNSKEIAAQHWVPYLPTMPTFLPPAPDALKSCRFSERVKQNRKNQGPVSRDQSHSGYKKQPRGTHYAFLNLPSELLSSKKKKKNYCPLPGHCGEPPPWEHEDTKRIYHFVVGQRVHYECIQGYKALQRGPAVSICRMTCGKTEWTQPRLTCVDEREHHQFPGTLC